MSMQSSTHKVVLGQLLTEPAQFVDQHIEVAGILQNEGTDAISDLRLILRDEEDRSIHVTPWHRPERAPSPVESMASMPGSVCDFLGEDVVLHGTWNKRDDSYLLQVERGDVMRSPSRRLTPEEVLAASGVGGTGVHGRGVLLGRLHMREERIVLVTDNHTRQEVCFRTDLSEREARAHDGARVAVAGTLRKLSPWSGTITRARLVDWPELYHVPGQYVALDGEVSLQSPAGAGGQAPPAGAWLVLSEPIHLRRLRTREVYLDTSRSFPEGYAAQLHGRISVRHCGGGESPQVPYAVLTGVSDVSGGEPFYDGVRFRCAADSTPLQAMILAYRTSVVDGPSVVLVLDPAQQKAYAGTLGGFHHPLENPFHGFYGEAPMARPTDADRAALAFDEEGNAFSAATGEKLRVLGREEPTRPHPDAMYARYLYDDLRHTVYRVVSGGIAGFVHHLAWVIRVPHLEEQAEEQPAPPAPPGIVGRQSALAGHRRPRPPRAACGAPARAG